MNLSRPWLHWSCRPASPTISRRSRKAGCWRLRIGLWSGIRRASRRMLSRRSSKTRTVSCWKWIPGEGYRVFGIGVRISFGRYKSFPRVCWSGKKSVWKLGKWEKVRREVMIGNRRSYRGTGSGGRPFPRWKSSLEVRFHPSAYCYCCFAVHCCGAALGCDGQQITLLFKKPRSNDVVLDLEWKKKLNETVRFVKTKNKTTRDPLGA